MVPSETDLLEESQQELIDDIGEATPIDDDIDEDGETVNLGHGNTQQMVTKIECFVGIKFGIGISIISQFLIYRCFNGFY